MNHYTSEVSYFKLTHYRGAGQSITRHFTCDMFEGQITSS